MRIVLLLLGFLVVPALRAAGIDQAVAESTAPDTYKITFTAAAGTGPISVFASSRPDRIDSAQPLATNVTSLRDGLKLSPAEVTALRSRLLEP